MSDPVPHLRRDPAPRQTNGRWVLVGVLVFFLALITFVLVLVFVIGLHNNGVKQPPPGQPPPGQRPRTTQPS